MKTQTNKAFTAFLTMLFSFYSTALFAQPTITAVLGGAPITCMSANPADANYSVIYQVNVPANTSVLGMSWAGDIVITSQPTTYPVNGGATGTSFTVTAESRNNGRELTNTCDDYLLPGGAPNNHLNVNATNWGFAKSRLTVSWNNGTCGDYVSLDIFKKFDLHPKIIGPGCLKKGDKITFSVCNILSGHNTPATLGQDKYYWTGDPINNYDNSNYPTDLDYLYSSADGSSITFSVRDYGFIGTKLYCRFGQCNPAAVSEITLNAITFPPGFQLFNSNQSSQLSNLNQVNNCIDAASGFSTIVLKITRPGTPVGPTQYTYELSSNNYSWGFGNSNTATYTYSTSGSSWTQTANIGNLGGEIYIKTKPLACEARTEVIRIGRNVILGGSQAAFSIIQDPQIGGSCVSSGIAGGYALNTFPGNIPVTWTYPYPTGWSVQGTSVGPPTLRLVAPFQTSQPGDAVTASIGGCSPTAPFLVYVRPTLPAGATAAMTYNGANYPTPSPVCVPRTVNPQTFTVNGGNYAVSYAWSKPTGWSGNSTSSSIAITANAGFTTSGILRVQGSADPPGNTCLSINSVYVTPVFASPTPGTITGPACLKGGNAYAVTNGIAQTPASSVSYSVPNVPGTTYEWFVPPALMVGTLNGQATSTISFTCSGQPSASDYEISVKATASGSSCQSAAVFKYVTVRLQNDMTNDEDVFASLLTPTVQRLTHGFPPASAPTANGNITQYNWYRFTAPVNLVSSGTLNYFDLIGTLTKNYGVEVTYNNYACKNVFAISSDFGSKMSKQKKQIGDGKSKMKNGEQKIVLKPNPAGNSTTLVLPEGIHSATVSIVTTEGKLVWKRSALSNGSTVLNTTNWPSSEYTVIVREQNKKPVTQQLIIQKH